MNLKTQIESILFISNRPLKIKQLSDLTSRGKNEVELVLDQLKDEYNQGEKGIRILQNNGSFQMVTDKDSSEVVSGFLKEEMAGEMTRPQIETLTIIAYRGPVTKMELEQIRGVNCSLILRNLQIRGLVEVETDKKIKTQVFKVTADFMRFLGITGKEELPDWQKLSSDERLEDLLNQQDSSQQSVVSS